MSVSTKSTRLEHTGLDLYVRKLDAVEEMVQFRLKYFKYENSTSGEIINMSLEYCRSVETTSRALHFGH